MKTLTLTEFNQNPSRATRLAEHEDVAILRRGVHVFTLSRVEQTTDPLQALVSSGQATAPRRAALPAGGLRTLDVPGLDIDALLGADRELDGGLGSGADAR